MVMKRLQIPLSEKDVRELKIGDMVLLNGLIFTAATLFHERMMKGILPPVDFSKANVMLHFFPLVRKVNGKQQLPAITPTASISYESYGPEVIKRLKVRAMIGKTTMGQATMGAMKDFGCVHLTRVGDPDSVLVHRTKEIMGIYFEKELGIAEATLLLNVENFGPFVVCIDAHGNNLFNELEKEADQKMKHLYERFRVPADFDYPATQKASSAKMRAPGTK